MKKISLFFWILVFIAVFFFVYSLQLKNDIVVVIKYYWGFEKEVGVFELLAVPFLVGLLLGVVIMSFSVFKHKRRASYEKKKLGKVEKEVENLRALPLKDEV